MLSVVLIVSDGVFVYLKRRRSTRRRHCEGDERVSKAPMEITGPKRRVVTRPLCAKVFSVDGFQLFSSEWRWIVDTPRCRGMVFETDEYFASSDSFVRAKAKCQKEG